MLTEQKSFRGLSASMTGSNFLIHHKTGTKVKGDFDGDGVLEREEVKEFREALAAAQKSGDEQGIEEVFRGLLFSEPDTEETKHEAAKRAIEEAPFLRNPKTGRRHRPWWDVLGFLRRCRDSRLGDIFFSAIWDCHVTVDEIDNIIGILSTVCALILGIPFNMLLSINSSGWSTLQDTVDACSEQSRLAIDVTDTQAFVQVSQGFPSAVVYYILPTPKSVLISTPLTPHHPSPNTHHAPPNTHHPTPITHHPTPNVQTNYKFMSLLLLPGILIPIMAIVCSVWWFMTRPSIAADQDGNSVPIGKDPRFRLWWSRGRYLFVIILVLTGTAMILDIFSTTCFYLLFWGPPLTFCSDYATRKQTLDWGWGVVVALLAILLYAFI